MDTPTSETGKNGSPQANAPRSRKRLFINLGISLAVIAAGIAVSSYLTKTAPKATKRTPVKMTPLVQVMEVRPEKHKVIVQAMGTVIPSRKIVLKSQVSGEIVSIHPEFTIGGLLKKGSEVLRIDPEDYRLALTLAQAKVKDAESNLQILEAEAESAREEWHQLYGDRDGNDKEPPPLVFKQPQLEAAKAVLMAEKAELQKARLNLERTRITAPFNAIVREKNVDIGSQVSAQEQLAELVGADEYWIQASIPMESLAWIYIPRSPGKAGAEVRIFHRDAFERKGSLIKLLGDLETEGRMARVLVEVKHPLGLNSGKKNQPPLLIGEYVKIEIDGQQLQDVYRIPRSALRDNSNIWVASDDGKMEIRKIETLWRDAQTVLFREGIRPGERLIVSDLPAPVNGMPVNVAR